MKVKKKLYILLVEDNLLNLKLALINLKKLGHIIDTAENGKTAIDKFKKNHYDVILMDIEMPEMNGIEATKIIRKLENQSNTKSKIKIIALTAHNGKDKEKYLSVGMDNLYAKPMRANEFSDIINYN